ncbi:MAG: AbrB/MazE/SpoVT family DNA-binding domain-containing protein [Candidatus Omnitrophica bacterium]|nr:AbrB/MazE/SpoVT family DNA-binding domain-containing protein [Candidatus Omnitrophota bacterium]
MNTVVKVQKNKNITLPLWLMRLFGVEAGDFLRIERTKNSVVLKPAKLVDPSQSYFWTKEWQKREREVDEEIRKGRVRKAISVEDLIRDLKA